MRPTTMTKTLLAMLFAFALVAAACASDEATDTATESDESTDTTEAAADAFPVTVTHDGGDTTIEAQPTRIVSLSPTATEMLFAIGAGDQVVAADSFSNYPADAPTTDLSGFEPSLEAIAAEDPDLVVLSFDTGEIASGLEEIGVPTLVFGSAFTIDDVYRQIAEFGIATGHIDEAAAVNAEIRTGIDEVVAGVEPSDTPVRIYHELDDTFFSASSNSFIGALYGLLGVENIADEADTDGFGFPQLSPEYLLEADPEVIVFTDQVGYSADDIAARPGWDAITAVANGNIVQVNADVASRWGPRIVEFLETVAAELAKVPAGS